MCTVILRVSCCAGHREVSPFLVSRCGSASSSRRFALAQDNAFGQPLESQLRSCLLASAMCEDAGFDAQLSETVYWVALLRYIGCTGHAHEVATALR